MTSIVKPTIVHRGLSRNKLGLTIRDYEGGMSTLCAGCGHDSVTAAIVQALFELGVPPHRVAKMSGIGCSSKTPAYFLGASHSFNAVHGRMPSIATGAAAANRELYLLGVSGDGDSLSIGLGQFAHAVRRNIDMIYIIENNGVYGLTKGQFSASADIGTAAKRGEVNQQPPIDPVQLAMALGGTFVARSFSGDKDQLVPLIKAGIRHEGFAVIDVLSPCVTFNDHESSTKSYAYTREHSHQVVHTDFIPSAAEIKVAYDEGEVVPIRMHDGSRLLLRKVSEDYNAHNRGAAIEYIRTYQRKGEVVTGLLYIDESEPDMHGINTTTGMPLNQLEFGSLCPGEKDLAALQDRYR
ncbi:2-oxoacid:ferredoxin oxidoreductase subunit beta [Candidatus Rariloculus sp.]|uniref:2-oxoacid:ferredoxin oxidoreductase subunit beta n=1 Tax=Candidatus Rariloculus sp. TaxID=3101265 RepID=UPI003D0C0CBB